LENPFRLVEPAVVVRTEYSEAMLVMNCPPSSLSSESPETVDWDEHPAGPGTINPTSGVVKTASDAPVPSYGGEGPPSGDATTLRSEMEPGAETALDPMDLIWEGVAPGTLIDGKYRVQGELGRGAMGIVVLAHDETLDRNVAVKLVQSHLASPGFHRRFLEEGKAMARVNHPNVVQVYACGEHRRVPYMVMELVTGSTLEKWMAQQQGHVDIGAAVRLLAAVCEGVTAIHEAETLHRDIKPSNILLDEDLRPRIADLGVSTVFESGRASQSEIVGTPAYMAPEVAFPIADDPPTHQADLYSLACVAYELLTGQPPVSAEDDRQFMIRHASVQPRRPSDVRPELPKPFDRVLLAALAKEPRERPASVEAFRRDLLVASGEGDEPVRILVAEDDDDFRQVLELGLRGEFPDAEVICVSNGRAALEVLDASPASVAILDLNMPDLGGFEVTQRLRATEASLSMPIIVLTGSGGPAEWRRLLSLGADRFLVKPVSLDDLVASVRHSVRARHMAPESSSSRRAASRREESSEIVAHESWLLPDDEVKTASVAPLKGE
jgi:serine/threonine protein kinase